MPRLSRVVSSKVRLRHQVFGDQVLMAYCYSGVFKKSSTVMRDSLFSHSKNYLRNIGCKFSDTLETVFIVFHTDFNVVDA